MSFSSESLAWVRKLDVYLKDLSTSSSPLHTPQIAWLIGYYFFSFLYVDPTALYILGKLSTVEMYWNTFFSFFEFLRDRVSLSCQTDFELTL